MQDQDSGPPPPPKTLPFDDNAYNRSAADKLGYLVEEYEAKLRVLTGRHDSGVLPDATYHDSLARERDALVNRVLREYTENCAVGAGYYENLTYTILRTRINVQDGVKRAFSRLEHDVRDVNNAYGEAHAELDVDSFETLVSNLNELWTLKMLLSGFGLESEAENILKMVAARKFGSTHRVP